MDDFDWLDNPPKVDQKTFGDVVKKMASVEGAFKLHMPILDNIDDIPNQPAVQKAMEGNPDLVFYDAGEFLDVINGAYALKNIHDPEKAAERATELRAELREAIKDLHPALADQLEAKIMWFAGVVEEGQYYGDPDKPSDKAIVYATAEIIKGLLEHGASADILNAEGIEPIALVQASDDHSGINYGELSKKIGFDVKPPPGTPKQHAATTMVHELEHILDNGQEHINIYFDKLEQALKDAGNNDYNIAGNKQHAIEIESAIIEVHALQKAVPKDVLEYNAAYFMASNFSKMMYDVHSGDALSVPESHATQGYAMMEYMQSGMPPDYLEHLSSVKAFYAKVDGLMEEKVSALRNIEGIKSYDISQMKTNIAYALNEVQEALKAESTVFTPEEAVHAHNFVKGMSESLGIEPKDIEVAVEQKLKSVNKPEDAPEATTNTQASLQGANPAIMEEYSAEIETIVWVVPSEPNAIGIMPDVMPAPTTEPSEYSLDQLIEWANNYIVTDKEQENFVNTASTKIELG